MARAEENIINHVIPLRKVYYCKKMITFAETKLTDAYSQGCDFEHK